MLCGQCLHRGRQQRTWPGAVCPVSLQVGASPAGSLLKGFQKEVVKEEDAAAFERSSHSVEVLPWGCAEAGGGSLPSADTAAPARWWDG